VGILSTNHDLYDQNKYNFKPIIIGDYSWIGMNSVVTAGVELGTRTIVGAGSVVTRSFPDGFCVIAGNPAKVIKNLNKEEFVPWHYEEEFYGFIPKEKFEKVRRKYISI
jgi:acetyltransferase-like isoleucine patch superfamily enzyme